ncbi:glycosyltransferase [Actinomyces culturomici]|uniref:glycosyltransferase n=1 Tax=Actinomyces culturomici TaxID=1926276 RepID=UPI001C554116|nr:glycosyltransferase family 2 protein [Actinomyces culturomici]
MMSPLHQRTRMDRAVGVMVLLLAAGAALVLVAGIVLSGSGMTPDLREGVAGSLHYIWDPEVPRWGLLIGASGLALALAGLVTGVEHIVATRARRAEDRGDNPLAPRVVMADTAGRFDGEVTITVCVPAHNEADRIQATLDSLCAQDGAPERIIVVTDNCTDRTVEIARAAGVDVFETIDNTHKKAGGLNQCLTGLLPTLGNNDCVMVMDADTVLDQGFLAEARRRLTADRALMTVGGLFYGEDGGGLLGLCQRNEYTRYSRDIERRQGKVFVLTGTATVFRARALRTVAQERGRLLPGTPGDVYDTAALTEDNEMTIALKSLGALMISPSNCRVVTEVMTTWKALWNQRLRWQRGALENLGTYGLTPQTSRYWSQQLGIGYGVLALLAYFVMMAIMALSLAQWVWFPFWLAVGGVFALERVVTAWKGGWAARFLAVLVIPELIYATYLNIVFCKGCLDILRAKQAEWTHVAADGSVVREEKP